MLVYEDTTAVVTSRAYQLAETGEFEDFAALKRALLAEGFGHGIEGLKKPPIENTLKAARLETGGGRALVIRSER